MRWFLKVTLFIIGAFAVVLVAAIIAIPHFAQYFSAFCATDVVGINVSPNGRLKAVEYVVNCGTLGDEVGNISVVEDSDVAPQGPNSANTFSMGPSGISSVRWLGNDKLLIDYDTRMADGHVYLKKGQAMGVEVKYRDVSRQ